MRVLQNILPRLICIIPILLPKVIWIYRLGKIVNKFFFVHSPLYEIECCVKIVTKDRCNVFSEFQQFIFWFAHFLKDLENAVSYPNDREAYCNHRTG